MVSGAEVSLSVVRRLGVHQLLYRDPVPPNLSCE